MKYTPKVRFEMPILIPPTSVPQAEDKYKNQN